MFALLLALRLLGSSGFMPTMDHGSLTLVSCPDAEINAPLAIGGAHHHHGHGGDSHSICPYAAAAALGATDGRLAPLVSILLVGMALLLIGRAFEFVERQNGRERPPAIGPPLPASI